MKYLKLLGTLLLICMWTNMLSLAQEKTANRAPVIKHEPVTAAVKGQSISVRVVVSDDSDSIKSVSLFYTASRDAAPFKIDMQSTGANSYFGSIPSSLLKGVNELSYYIEAVDEQDSASETPWYTVKIQVPQPVTAQPAPAPKPVSVQPPAQAQAAVPAAKQVEPPKESWSWKGPAIIAGSAAAVVGGAMLAANSGGGGDDNSTSSNTGSGTGSGGTSTSNEGNYSGTATKYLQMSGGTPASESYAIAISINSSGTVASDNLHPNTHQEALLNGSSFQMVAPISQTNMTGQIIYSGTVINGVISGSIVGSITSSTGTNGTYSGNFSATK